jgi:hypothetical protein
MKNKTRGNNAVLLASKKIMMLHQNKIEGRAFVPHYSGVNLYETWSRNYW